MIRVADCYPGSHLSTLARAGVTVSSRRGPSVISDSEWGDDVEVHRVESLIAQANTLGSVPVEPVRTNRREVPLAALVAAGSLLLLSGGAIGFVVGRWWSPTTVGSESVATSNPPVAVTSAPSDTTAATPAPPDPVSTTTPPAEAVQPTPTTTAPAPTETEPIPAIAPFLLEQFANRANFAVYDGTRLLIFGETPDQPTRDGWAARLSAAFEPEEVVDGLTVGDAGGAPTTTVRVLLAEPGATLLITGHSDGDNTPERDLELSQFRADAIRNYLIDQGIDPARLRAEGRGFTQPILAEDTPGAADANRRVDLVFEGVGTP
jgi:hypothetical protein